MSKQEMAKGSILQGLAALVLGTMSPTLLACSCPGPFTVSEEAERSAAVFTGRVVQMKLEDRFAGRMRFEVAVVRFIVRDRFKGVGKEATEVIVEAGQAGTCGYTFELGNSYLVYASQHYGGALSTGICSRTRALVVFREKDPPASANLVRDDAGEREAAELRLLLR